MDGSTPSIGAWQNLISSVAPWEIYRVILVSVNKNIQAPPLRRFEILKTLNETFVDEEYAVMKAAKDKLSKSIHRQVSWHDFIYALILDSWLAPEGIKGTPYGVNPLEKYRKEAKTE